MSQQEAAPLPQKAAVSSQVTASDARELSAVFRNVAKKAFPSIVSIETKGKVQKVAEGSADPFEGLEGSPFGDLFSDPRFKEMFKNRPKSAPALRGMGSGFIIDPSGIILTNNHVVADAEQVKVKLWDGTIYTGTDIRTDPRSDVAIVRIKADKPLQALPLGDSDATEIGDFVLAVGSPFGLDLTVTSGIISAKGRGPGITEREDFLQTDAAINPGNSGGPLLNLDGQVIGINTAISSRTGGWDGVGFAIPINMAGWVGRQLIDHGTVSRAYLGIGIQPVNDGLARQFKIPVGEGAIVSQVMPGSPAAEAEVESGDVVLKFDGKKVNDPRGLQGIVERLKIGEKYELEVLRDGKLKKLNIVLKEMPKEVMTVGDKEQSEDAESPKSDSFDELGVEIQAATAELTKQLGYTGEVSGVVIASVKEDSPAATAGLRTGMVIEKVGSRRVSSPEDFSKAMKDASLEKGVLLLVRNLQGTQFVVVNKDM